MKIKNELLSIKIGNKHYDFNNLILDEYLSKFVKAQLEKEKLKEEYLKKLNEELEEIRLEALMKLESIKDKKQENVVKQIQDLKKEHKNVEVKKAEVFELGDNVRIKDGEQIGTIIKIQGKRVDVNINGLIIKTEIKYLKKIV